jgi:hypothetical protein
VFGNLQAEGCAHRNHTQSLDVALQSDRVVPRNVTVIGVLGVHKDLAMKTVHTSAINNSTAHSSTHTTVLLPQPIAVMIW